MAKGYKENEKEAIRAALVEKGREYFARYGLKKTGIEDLTKAVGIAQGSFYSFFPSKEELFFEIMEKEQEAFGKNIPGPGKTGGLSREYFKRLLLEGLLYVDGNEFFKIMFDPGELERLVRKVSPERLSKHSQYDNDAFVRFIRQIDGKGPVAEIRPEVLTGLLRALFAIPFFKKAVGEDVYPEVLELLADIVSKGLISEGDYEED